MRTALVLPEESELHYDYTRQSKRPYDDVLRIAIAFCDGAFVAERVARRAISPHDWILSPRCMDPDYATLRNYLIDEANADWRVAAQIALRLTAPLRRMT